MCDVTIQMSDRWGWGGWNGRRVVLGFIHSKSRLVAKSASPTIQLIGGGEFELRQRSIPVVNRAAVTMEEGPIAAALSFPKPDNPVMSERLKFIPQTGHEVTLSQSCSSLR